MMLKMARRAPPASGNNESSFSRFAGKLMHAAFFSTMATLTKDVFISKAAIVALFVIDIIQMLVIPLSPRSNFPWASQG